jgi:undecaprenyl-diphosphatase
MQELLQAIVLGIVQGLTEFLPVSSSGHLIVVRELFGWKFEDDLTLDVALHLGTTAAVLGFFRYEWLAMAASALRWAANRRDPSAESVYDARLLLLLALGTVPAAAVGFVFNDYVEENVRDPLIVGAMLVAFALVLFAAERWSRRTRRVAAVGWLDAVLIGCAQAVALIPGVSRSGATMSAALARDFDRPDAARFSFLLATPIIIGAGLLQLGTAVSEGIAADKIGTMAAGAVAAAVTGWLAIAYLLRFLQSATFLPFVVYRAALGVFVLAYFAV